MDTIAKPDELLALDSVTEELFDTLRSWFDVPVSIALDLRGVDSAVEELGDPQLAMAMAMRKLQALHLLATPGVTTTTDVVVTIVQDVNRALLTAPTLRLKLAAADTDWDAALEQLVDPVPTTGLPGSQDAGEVPAVGDPDPETERFRELHAKLHEAAAAVLRVSDGEIRYLV